MIVHKLRLHPVTSARLPRPALVKLQHTASDLLRLGRPDVPYTRDGVLVVASEACKEAVDHAFFGYLNLTLPATLDGAPVVIRVAPDHMAIRLFALRFACRHARALGVFAA